MGDVFRILDRFKIAGRGIIYTIENNNKANIRIGDILFDLRNNGFKVKGVEMLRRLLGDNQMDEIPVGILLEPLSGAEVNGTILARNLKDINFLFCNHPLYQRRVDEDYEEEYQAAGLDHACALFSFEDMETGTLSLYGEEISGLTVYRGWMMKPEMYRDFYSKLEERGIILINTPKEYEKYHLLPGWYDDFKKETAATVWETQGNVKSALLAVASWEGACIVKDYVKSRKHEWYDACFIPNISDTPNASKVIGNFIDRQGEDLVGGVVLRRFEKLKQIGFHERSGMPLSEEYRVFIYAGQVLAVDDYWTENTGAGISDEEYQWIKSIAKRVKSNFVSLDLARREDGTLTIMEFGDGQVSGLQQFKPEEFYGKFRQQRER